jgi:hypothetical protein
MTNYKHFYIWFNELQNKWLVQCGYDVLGGYKTLSAAKSAITQKWSKN